MTPCVACGGLLAYSREDEADWCMNCGRLFYRFVPEPIMKREPHRKYSKLHENLRGRLAAIITNVLTARGSPMALKDLHQAVLMHTPATYRYVSWTLAIGDEFVSAGGGMWTLVSDSGIE